MSPDAAELLGRADRVESAVDLEEGLDPPRLHRALVELFGEEGASSPASPRALWNLLWTAAELSTRVDIYRAAELLSAVERLFVRRFAAATDNDPAAEAAWMAFDFFFNQREQPLATLRFAEVVATLERVMRLDSRLCRRAALHGLGHLRRRHDQSPRRERLEAAIDLCTDPALADYARLARAGDVQ